MAEITLCEDCDHVERESRKKQPYGWLCMMHPCAEKHGFVTRDTWTNGEPYLRCKDVNGGFCKLFTRKADGQMKLDTGDI